MKPLSWVERQGERGPVRPESRGRRAGRHWPLRPHQRFQGQRSAPRTWTHGPARAHPSSSAGRLAPTARAAAAWQALCYQLPQLPGADRRPESPGSRGKGDTASARGIPEHRSAATARSPSRLPLQFPPDHVGLQ